MNDNIEYILTDGNIICLNKKKLIRMLDYAILEANGISYNVDERKIIINLKRLMYEKSYLLKFLVIEPLLKKMICQLTIKNVVKYEIKGWDEDEVRSISMDIAENFIYISSICLYENPFELEIFVDGIDITLSDINILKKLKTLNRIRKYIRVDNPSVGKGQKK